MAIPATSPLFATDATFTADGDTWAGDATKVDPGGTIRAEGYEPDLLPAEWLNFQLNLLGAWIDWHENGDPVSTKNIRVGPRLSPGTHQYSTGTTVATALTVGTGWREHSLVALGPPDVISPQGHQFVAFPGVRGFQEISDLLPTGSKINAITFQITPGTATATAGNRMACSIWRRTVFGVYTQIGSTGFATASAVDQNVIVAGGDYTVDRSAETYHVSVTSSQDAAADFDVFEGLTLSLKNIGDRNY